MEYKDKIAIVCGKLFLIATKILNLGAGGTWPGEIATRISPHILKKLAKGFSKGIILVAGTNGKTTTSLMITQVLTRNGFTVVHNSSGANLLNGVVSACIQKTDCLGKLRADYAVFEVDENSLPIVLKYISPQVVVLLNLFRDQLDRYGEVDVIAEKWQKALVKLSRETKLILNADDPQIAALGKSVDTRVHYFGIDNPKLFLPKKEHATDSTFCPQCGSRLNYSGIYFSHLGIWNCPKCKFRRPKPNISNWPQVLPGLYNLYNTLAAVSTLRSIGISDQLIKKALQDFKPAFGRQEEFFIDDPTSPFGLRGASKKIKLFLSKNPAGFNASLRTVLEMKPRVLLLLLNDRVPDGKDVSWIWDVDFEMIPENVKFVVSGDRVYDMALRIKYAQNTQEINNLIVESELDKALDKSLKTAADGETIFVLATYSAMLDIRKLIGGKRIL